MSRWRAVVFDLDDTLYPERAFVRSGFEAVGRWASDTFGVASQTVFDELWGLFEAGIRGDTFDRWLVSRGRPANDYREAMIAAYRNHRPRLTPYPDVLPALESLRGQVRLGLITEGHRSVQEAKIEALGVRSRFDKIVVLGAEERQDWRPSRHPFDRWLDGSEVPPEAAVYLADNPAKDFLGAWRAGWASIRVRRSDGLHRTEEPASAEARPTAEIPDLRSLSSVLSAIEGRL